MEVGKLGGDSRGLVGRGKVGEEALTSAHMLQGLETSQKHRHTLAHTHAHTHTHTNWAEIELLLSRFSRVRLCATP